MATPVFTRPFLEDVARADKRVRDEVWAKAELVASFPGVGSALVPEALQTALGQDCLKVAVFSLELIYRRVVRQDDELVVFLALMLQRRAR